MKPSTSPTPEPHDPRDRKPAPWPVGARVEREIDGLWFPATVVEYDEREDAYEIEYDEDQNREADVQHDELRRLCDGQPNDRPTTARPRTAQPPSELWRDSLLLQPTDYDPNKAPTVVLHHRGESNAGTYAVDVDVEGGKGMELRACRAAAASAYIINGLENNIAAGNGLRGIRWLRVNSL
ncbi:hypothetical protein P43SY_009450 [Pythium insidiosum]|uniref:Tudor domain-containing protein n=1 Tax=Pythium insidiosum TaxID=114742 RepID=A0AAD5M6M0_PYTIN|nr:hypothetical protein P43SY_009450 [Pythium insidiosum]